MTNEELTPEYIVDKFGELTRDELIDLIIRYGFQEYEKGSFQG